MKRTLAIAAVLLFAVASTALAELHGSWTADSWETKPDRLQLNMSRGRSHNYGHSMNLSELTNLSEAQVAGATAVPVQFQLVREAGTISFEGSFKNGDGAGQWTFAPNGGVLSSLRALGVEFERAHQTEEEELLSLALLDVSTAYIKSMQAIGYRESLEKYTSMRIFRVTPQLVSELRSLGFDRLSADELVTAQIHKVTPDYIRQMRAAGYNLKFDDLIAFRIHRVDAQFINDLRDLGYEKVDADDLVAMRIHRVTPAYIRELKSAGYSRIPVQKLIEMRIHRIDAKFIEGMKE